jgi:hypothetical protein
MLNKKAAIAAFFNAYEIGLSGSLTEYQRQHHHDHHHQYQVKHHFVEIAVTHCASM